jgi:peptidoglycan L-alanyl-D-glutamate endopeptidase CwlK
VACRDLDHLLPHVKELAEQWLQRIRADGVTMLVYCTYRSAEEQDALYAMGRTAPGAIVTNARGWQSLHQYGRAWDAVPLRNGKPLWRYAQTYWEWQVAVKHADELGIEWGGHWRRPDYAHWQVSDGMTWRELYRKEGPKHA